MIEGASYIEVENIPIIGLCIVLSCSNVHLRELDPGRKWLPLKKTGDQGSL